MTKLLIRDHAKLRRVDNSDLFSDKVYHYYMSNED